MSNVNHLYYKNLLPNDKKNSSKRCSSSYRQRLKRIQTNCQLIRQRRRHCLFPINPIELRTSLFQQRYYQTGSLESLNVNDTCWQTTNILRLSDEYLYKCKYAMFSSTNRYFKQNEFYKFLRELFSYSCDIEICDDDDDRNQCQLCKHQFISNEMFDLHLNRRSISIEYRCLTCQSWIKAMNPCQAYSHLISHSKDARIGQLNINFDWQTSLTFIDDLFSKYSE